MAIIKAVKEGDRVGAVRDVDGEVVRFFGYGVYQGRHVPPKGDGTGIGGYLHERGCKNSKILLDNGDTVWGYQCWWAAEKVVREYIEGSKIVEVRVEEMMKK